MPRNSSTASRCTSARVWARQTCPARPRVTVPMVSAAALGTSASANTSAGLLPPSSRLTRLNPAADAAMILRPTARLPVNESLSTIGWLISASPVGSPGPVTMFSTPGGSPASSISRASRSTANVAYSDGLATIVQPAARAGAAFWANSSSGAFHGIAALERRQRLPGQLVDPPGVMLEDVGHHVRGHPVHRAEAQRHAVVQGLQRQQLVAVLADQLGDPAQDPDPLAGPGPRPGPLVEGLPGGPHGLVHVIWPGDRE